jgi:hypothetical protein
MPLIFIGGRQTLKFVLQLLLLLGHYVLDSFSLPGIAQSVYRQATDWTFRI